MRFLPIVRRELGVAARRRGTYWVRTWVAFTVVIIGTWIVLINQDAPPRNIAQMLFYSVTGGGLLYCLLIGMRTTADCISEERREGTLGLLFLTDLKGYDVVLGKLVANSLNSFYGLLAVFPVITVSLLMGGLTLDQIARASLVLMNTMFFSVCVGIFASASSRVARKSIGLTLFLLLLFTMGFPALGGWLAWKTHSAELGNFLLLPSPVFSYVAGMDAQIFVTGRKSFAPFYSSVAVIHGLGWIFLLVACFVAPRGWQDRPAGSRRVRWNERWKSWSHGDGVMRAGFRAQLLDANAFFWLAARDRLKPAWVWTFLGLIAAVWVWGFAKFQNEWFNLPVYFATAFGLNSVLKSWFAAEATRQLSDERRMGSLELLLSTPLGVRDILRGQALALRRQFLGPVAVTLLLELTLLVAGPRDSLGGEERLVWAAVWITGMVTLVTDLIALYWLGMWMGLASKNPKRSSSDTVGRVLALPWVIFAGFMLFMALISVRGHSEVDWKTFLGFWIALSLAVDLAYGLWARRKLLTEFREAATRRYQARLPLWKRLSGRADVTGELPVAGE